jgi:RimJ/RimL family protein N-acetyltransferase
MTLPITTERLVLRRFDDEDAADLLAMVAHPSVARTTPEIEASAEGVRRYVEMQRGLQPFEQGKCFDLALERKGDGQVIGLVSLVCREHRQAEIGWALGVEHRGQGFATEAARALLDYGFARLGLHRIQASTSSRNPGSLGVMERLGMRLEARLREVELQDGAWEDELAYAILSREWMGRGGGLKGTP